MVGFEDALRKVMGKAVSPGTESKGILEAEGSVLAADIRSRVDIPPFNKSAMDGYALRSEDVKSGMREFRSLGILPAGKFFRRKLVKGECLRIMTGSPLPDGADCVVMVEETTESGKGIVKISRSIVKWENVCMRGEDLPGQKIVLKKGTLLRTSEVSVLASIGLKNIKVYRKPEVSLLCTGDEIVEPGEALKKGKIYNSNMALVSSVLSSLGLELKYLGISSDTESDLLKRIKKGLRSDVFLVSGGVSVGDYDLVPETLRSSGVNKVFHKVSIKPGKPLFFGTFAKKLVFGLPGNPVSTYVILLAFVKPALEKMMGREVSLRTLSAIASRDIERKKANRRSFIPAVCEFADSRYKVCPVKGYHGSADMVSLVGANSFIILPPGISHVGEGEPVEVIFC